MQGEEGFPADGKPSAKRLIEMNDDRVGAFSEGRQGVMNDIELHALNAGWDAPFLHVLDEIGDIKHQAR